ncbi:MAG: SAM-dependent methyltransferase [Lachnospiraceae bacterium]|nr:SAM-dependent methyltransferase [Lachnospiraceae bacterium]
MNIDEEKSIDSKYGMDTCGRDDSGEDNEHHAYEPTPYDVLGLIAESGFIKSSDVLVDMGAGKGRASIYFTKETGCKAKGIEYDEAIFKVAERNIETSKSGERVTVINTAAEKYEIDKEDTVFFFFNPFSAKILETVLSNIENSYYDKRREIKLIFYYPSLEYVGRLMTKDYLEFVDEIDCSHLYKDKKGRECVMIFRVSPGEF